MAKRIGVTAIIALAMFVLSVQPIFPVFAVNGSGASIIRNFCEASVNRLDLGQVFSQAGSRIAAVGPHSRRTTETKRGGTECGYSVPPLFVCAPAVSLWRCYPVTNINCNRVCSFCIAAATSVKLSAERAGPSSGSEVMKG